jgi:hypothetical protein
MTTIVGLMVFPLIAMYMIMFRKNTTHTALYDIKTGLVCYSCGEKIHDTEEEKWNSIIKGEDGLTICTSCQRDTRINEVNGVKDYSLIIRKFLYDKKIEKYQLYILITMLVFIVIGIPIDFMYNNNIFILFANLTNCSYWIFLITKETIFRKNLPADKS